MHGNRHTIGDMRMDSSETSLHGAWVTSEEIDDLFRPAAVKDAVEAAHRLTTSLREENQPTWRPWPSQ